MVYITIQSITLPNVELITIKYYKILTFYNSYTFCGGVNVYLDLGFFKIKVLVKILYAS